MNVAIQNFLSALFRHSRRPQRARRSSVRLGVEALERRLAPATIHVTSHGDNTFRDSSITLREALQIANGDLPLDRLSSYERAILVEAKPGAGGRDTIAFALNATRHDIEIFSPLPVITRPVVIDGASQ